MKYATVDPVPTPTSTDFHVFDTTLRDGAQREGVSYSVADKLAVARLLEVLRPAAEP